jgi:hypothetical protein
MSRVEAKPQGVRDLGQRIKLARTMGKVLVDTGFGEYGFLSTCTFVPTPFAPVFFSCAPSFRRATRRSARRSLWTAHKQELSPAMDWAIAGSSSARCP